MLFLFDAAHELTIFLNSRISLDEGFSEVHDVLVGRLFESVYTDGSEIAILDILNELQSFLKILFFLNRNVITHFLI